MFLKSLNSFTTLNSEESTLFKNVNGAEWFCENKLLNLKKKNKISAFVFMK